MIFSLRKGTMRYLCPYHWVIIGAYFTPAGMLVVCPD